ncbi:MAG: MMPL family transporter [Myxococcota bacterium]|nr:MMPL family transporter [Myxococcota bacterium]
MFDRIATTLLRARWVPLFVLLGLTAFAAFHASSIRFDFSPRSIFLTADDELAFLTEHREIFGEEDGVVLVLMESEEIFQTEVLSRIVDISDRMEQLEGIDRVLSLSTMRELRGSPPSIEVAPLIEEVPEDPEELRQLKAHVLESRLFLHRFINPEATASAILAIFKDELVEETDRRPYLNEIESILDEFRGEGVELQMAGVPVVNREYAVRLQQDMTRAVLVSIFLICIVLYLLFRNAYGVIVPIAAVTLSLCWSVGYMVLAGDSFNIINSIIPTLLLVVGIADAVHFLTAYYQEVGDGVESQQAVRRMVRRIGAACLLTSVTAATGFASLMVAHIDIIKGMGRVAAVGLMLAYVVILTLVPTVLSLARAPQSSLSRPDSEGYIGRLLTWTSHMVTERPGTVIASTLVICGLCVLGSQRVETNNFLLEELFPSNPVSKAMHRTEDAMTGVMPVEISIRTDAEGGVLEPDVLRGMVAIQEHMADDPFIGHSVSIADLIQEIGVVMEGQRDIPETRRGAVQRLLYFEMGEDTGFLDSMVNVNRSRARISTTQRDWGTNNFFSWYDGSGECDPRAKCGTPILQLVDEVFGTENGLREGLEVRVTGSNLVAANALSRLVTDMVNSLLLAFVVITLLMAVLLRSLRIGLLSMVPNIIPLLVTAGFMGWVGIPLRTSTALIFSVALGIAVNDTIHITTRFREELFLTGDRKEAVRRTMMSTGRAIIFTSILMIFGFSTMMTTRFVGLFQMGLLGAVTLSAALIGDLLLLPACLVIFRPWSRFIEKRKANGTWKPIDLSAQKGAVETNRIPPPG